MNIPKVRVFYKRSKRMYFPQVISYDASGKITGFIIRRSGEEKDVSKFIVMQSTGLTDKNGVEIFEGDVVKIEKNICKVEFEEQGVRYVLKNINSERNHLYFNKQSFERCQVIGNIYENPDLFEGVEQ